MTIRVRDILDMLNRLAPPMAALERDNIGIQCGDPGMTVRGILVCLDITEDVVADALRRHANVIVSHHPLLYRPLKSLTPETHTARTLTALVQNNIAALAAHTNLDASPDGTSHALARALGVSNPEVLEASAHLQVKLVTFMPADDVERVAGALAATGAGRIGNYEQCSFRNKGTGTFRGNADSSPAVGRKETLEHVDEVRLEMIVDRDGIPSAIAALRSAHPYEEPAYDIIPVENRHQRIGMGAVGNLVRPMPLAAFLRRIKRTLGTGALRYTGNGRSVVSRVAVCGGSGSAVLEHAIAGGADVFVTADVPFHRFQDAAGRIALVDAGHHETEFPVLAPLAGNIREACRARGASASVAVSTVRTNSIAYV